jgi:hypothetical protein
MNMITVENKMPEDGGWRTTDNSWLYHPAKEATGNTQINHTMCIINEAGTLWGIFVTKI